MLILVSSRVTRLPSPLCKVAVRRIAPPEPVALFARNTVSRISMKLVPRRDMSKARVLSAKVQLSISNFTRTLSFSVTTANAPLGMWVPRSLPSPAKVHRVRKTECFPFVPLNDITIPDPGVAIRRLTTPEKRESRNDAVVSLSAPSCSKTSVKLERFTNEFSLLQPVMRIPRWVALLLIDTVSITSTKDRPGWQAISTSPSKSMFEMLNSRNPSRTAVPTSITRGRFVDAAPLMFRYAVFSSASGNWSS